jgi:predicted RNA binding protein YcfA (HicA-like mRNA interferase family)
MAMQPAAFLAALKRLARKRGWTFDRVEGASHTHVTLNGRRTVVPRHAKDMRIGTFRAILKQLGLTPTDLED